MTRISRSCRHIGLWFAIAVFAFAPSYGAGQQYSTESLNKPDRIEWFRDQGFGIFIHWSLDNQLGTVISHSLVDASPSYTERFFNDLPKTFYPGKFDPDDLARLIKISGATYTVMTTKHHSGFCMFPTATTGFSVAGTPFQRNITGELFTSLRKQQIATGVYFSPDDFHWLYEHHIPINRNVPSVQFAANPGLLQYDQQQLTELMTNFGKVDIVFFDGEAAGLRDIAWKLQPDTVVTRGAIATPEQAIPGAPLPGAWEANLTIGTSWGYKPDHEFYKSGPQLIDLLIKTRARGGNLLLNISPMPNGELPIEEEERLREIGLWMFVNSDAIYGVRPWNITNEGDIWFTQKGGAVYAIVDDAWKRGTTKDIVLKSVRATAKTEISVLGQNSKVFEYTPRADTKLTFSQQPDGLHIHAFRTQRLYDTSGGQTSDHTRDESDWPNAAVLRITHAEQAFIPPTVHTLVPQTTPAGTLLQGTWENRGLPETVEVGFEYRDISGEDTNSRSAAWKPVPGEASMATPGPFRVTAVGVFTKGVLYEVRAVVKHPLLTIYGEERPINSGLSK